MGISSHWTGVHPAQPSHSLAAALEGCFKVVAVSSIISIHRHPLLMPCSYSGPADSASSPTLSCWLLGWRMLCVLGDFPVLCFLRFHHWDHKASHSHVASCPLPQHHSHLQPLSLTQIHEPWSWQHPSATLEDEEHGEAEREPRSTLCVCRSVEQTFGVYTPEAD